MIDAFGMINSILNQSVKGIADIITKPGHINVDFADVRTIMKDMGLAIMGTGKATGKDRALDAAYQAISSPLLENMTIKGARGILINISGGLNLGLHEIGIAASVIAEQAEENASIIVGSVIDRASNNDEIIVTVIATGFSHQTRQAQEAPTFKPAVEQNALPEPEVISVKSIQRIEQIPVQPVIAPTEKPVFVAAPEKEEVVHHNIDINDLDVPTFLRQQKEVSNHE